MTIIKRENRSHNYMVVSNEVFQNTYLSWAAKGLLGYLLSMPDSWQIHINYLVQTFISGRDATYKLISELKAAGYIEHVYGLSDDKGRFLKGEYIIREIPVSMVKSIINNEKSVVTPMASYPCPENPDVVQNNVFTVASPLPEKPCPGNPYTVNQDTYKINNNKINIKKTTTVTDVDSCVVPVNSTEAVVVSLNFSSTRENLVIGQTLNPCQILKVQEALSKLDLQAKYADSHAQMLEQIIFTLEQPGLFSASGDVFLKKLNSVMKVVARGEWSAPMLPKAVVEQKVVQQEVKSAERRHLYHQLVQEVHYCQQTLAFHQQRNDFLAVKAFTQQLFTAQQNLVEFEATVEEGRVEMMAC